MARLRSNARQAPRFQNQGQGQYESGYQFRTPTRAVPKLGPWDRVHPKGRRDLPQNVLNKLQDGLLIDGMIVPSWLRTVGGSQSHKVLGAFEFRLLAGTYHAIFYSDASAANELKFELTSLTTSINVATGVVLNDEGVTATGWQNRIYFSHKNLTAIYSYDVLTNVVSAIASTFGAEFLFMLDNNLVGIYKNGIPYQVSWSVDSNPSDWTGYGSGAKIIPGAIGEVMGFGHMLQGRTASVLIAGSAYGIVMSPTGFLPAFRFDTAPGFNGLLYKNAIDSVNDTIYYINIERRLTAYTPGEMRKAGEGEDAFDNETLVYYSRRLDSIVVSCPDRGTYMLNYETNQWVSKLEEVWDYVTDSPSGTAVGMLVGLVNDGVNTHTRTTLDAGAATYTLPEFKTGMTRFQQPVMVNYVDIQHTDLITYAPLAEINCLLGDGSILTIDFDETRRSQIQIQGPVARYWIDQILYGIEITTRTPLPEDGWYSGVLNAAGNYVDDGQIDIGHQRGDMNISGNIVPSAGSLGYIYGGFNTSGNMTMVENLNQWPRTAAIDYVNFGVRNLSSEQSS